MSVWITTKVGDWVAQSRYKVAFSIKDLVQLTSDFSVAKAKNCNMSVKNVDLDEMLLTYKVKCKEKDSDPRGHTVLIRFDTAQVVDKSTIKDLDVKVSCSCPAFLYWGAQWNLGQGDSLEGTPRDKYQAPTDPRRFQFVICKHLKIVSDRVNPFLKRLLEKFKDKNVEKTLERYDDTVPTIKPIEDDDDEIVEINKPVVKEKLVEQPPPVEEPIEEIPVVEEVEEPVEEKPVPEKKKKVVKKPVEVEEKVVERTTPVKSH
jgi:hypothetical protein